MVAFEFEIADRLRLNIFLSRFMNILRTTLERRKYHQIMRYGGMDFIARREKDGQWYVLLFPQHKGIPL